MASTNAVINPIVLDAASQTLVEAPAVVTVRQDDNQRLIDARNWTILTAMNLDPMTFHYMWGYCLEQGNGFLLA